MKLIPLLIMCVIVAVNLSAQIDSTFVRYYYPTTQTLPAWESFPISQTLAANVFEAYDGNFVLQAMATFHSPPPEWVFPQSPMMLYSRNGVYQSTLFGPQVDGDIVEGYYTRIVKDGLGGYLALDSHYHRLQRLDANLQYVEQITLYCTDGIMGSVNDILRVENGFIITGYIQGTNNTGIVKYNYALECLWQYQTPVHSNASITTTSDGGILYNWWYSPMMRLMKITADGDSLWTKEYIPGAYKESIIESNGNYFGLRYNDNVVDGLLRVYDYGVDFSIINPNTPILTIPTYELLDEEIVFPAIRTNDNNIILAVSTPTGEIFKFDGAFNMLWSSNALPIERIGVGKHPLLELDNGDILYCATVIELPRRLGLVRIDSNGNYVGVSDDTEQTPPTRCISAYPNPFTAFTNLKVILPSKLDDSMPRVTTASIDIYNIKGQKVKSISLDPNKTIEQYTYWDGRDAGGKKCSSGIYFLNLSVNGKRCLSKKVTLFR
ncbi:MAG: T9SS type A sorting domain-containing protein [Candidatus Cloacimonas sp.]